MKMLELVFPSNKIPQTKNEDKEIIIFDSRIRYHVKKGNGPYLLLLHSFGANMDTWNPLVEQLDCGTAISLDLIGFGCSDKPRIDYHLETHRKYILEFMDALHIKKALLIGISMGASIAAWTAAKSPERISGCVLFAPSGYPSSMWHKWPNRLFYRPGFLNKIAQIFINNRLFNNLYPSSLARQALGVTSTYDKSFAEALTNIIQPTLIIWSPGDKRVDFAYSQKYLKKIQNASLIERPFQVGHDIASFAPQKTSMQICSFISNIN